MWYLFHMQGMFAILKLFLFAVKVVMDQEQSNGRSQSGGSILSSCVPCEPGCICQESSAASASLSRGSFSSQDTEFTHSSGWEAAEEREFPVFFIRPQSLLFYPQ